MEELKLLKHQVQGSTEYDTMQLAKKIRFNPLTQDFDELGISKFYYRMRLHDDDIIKFIFERAVILSERLRFKYCLAEIEVREVRVKNFDRFAIKVIEDYSGLSHLVKDLYGLRILSSNFSFDDLQIDNFNTIKEPLDGCKLIDINFLKDYSIVNAHFYSFWLGFKFEVQILKEVVKENHENYEVRRLPKDIGLYQKHNYIPTMFEVFSKIKNDNPVKAEVIKKMILTDPVDGSFKALISALHDSKVVYFNSVTE